VRKEKVREHTASRKEAGKKREKVQIRISDKEKL
jgi:hypothetical protein